mmetsp:Transcript_60274/g.135726  ORF Transcript_60274/g.135726 Transcript_60274/m.135726 type:complete len:692 (-) Transcript_60274:10-2085(-)
MASGVPGTRKLEVDGSLLEITPLGAGAEVGRSCCILKFRGKVVMFDCGVHPAHSGMSCLPYLDNINPSEIDLLLVTHFHLDHSGAVPYFVNRTKFDGRVFMTHPTRPICRMLWHDYARISKIAAEDQIFSSQDVDETMPKIELINFHEERQHKGIKFSCYGAGHVLGACMFLVEIGGVRVLYTGDFSREVDRHLPQAELPPGQVHVLIVESTYGIMNHEPRDQREHRFTNSVHQIVRQGGKCLLPVFALGRAQEILLLLEDYWDRNPDLQGIPIYYNSPMAHKCLRVFETYTNMCSEKVQEQANQCNNPWLFKYIKNMPDRHEFVAQESSLGACVVLAAPGLMNSGASRELFEVWAPDKRNGIIVTGYSVGGTLAGELRNGPDSVTLNDGRKVSIHADVKFISFSAHSDYNQTSEFIKHLKASVVVLMHGEEEQMNRMRNRLREDFPELNVSAPQNCQSITVRVPTDRSVDVVGSLAEEVTNATSKRIRKDKPLNGLLFEDPTGSRMLVGTKDLVEYTMLKPCKVEQCQRFAFPYPLKALAGALLETYDDVEAVDGSLVVCGCVEVALVKQVLSVTWQASPMVDLIADSVSLTAIELSRNPTAVQALQSEEDPEAREMRLVKVMRTYLQREFGTVQQIGEDSSHIRFVVDGVDVTVDFEARSVECANQALQERIRQGLRRCQTALQPLAPF